MINTGKYFEGIVEMLNNFRSELQTFSALGLLNINKHSENFMKRILNLTYGYELNNLNYGKSNYPGIDLGDSSEEIAFQLTSTKKSEKIDDTLATCLKHEHYKTFKQIKIFILTTKQASYTIKTSTTPHFTFSAEKDIIDFNDLFRVIEHLDPIRMEGLYTYIKAEMHPVINALKNNKVAQERPLLDVKATMEESRMNRYFLWRSKVQFKTENIIVPVIYAYLKELLPSPVKKNLYLSIFNDTLRKTYSNKEILYLNKFIRTHQQNYFYGNSMLLEPSSITFEKADYTNSEILLNLKNEMVSLIACILLFGKNAKSSFEIEISIALESNTTTYFHPTGSLVLERLLSTFTLDSPFNTTEIITNIHTSTLADLLQSIMYAFVSQGPSLLTNEPFLIIKREATEFVINNIKKDLGITY